LSYSVFIERAIDGSPEGVRAVAERVGKRFGAPTEALVQRIAKGRFRVKANVDREKADRFAEELHKLGAEASIYDAAGTRVDGGKETAPATSAPPPAAAPEPPQKPATDPDQYQSGLAAAFSGESEQQDLGALAGGDMSAGDSLRLASLDGEDEGTVAADERAPSAVAAAAPVAAEEEAFLPPEMSDEAKNLELLTPLPAPMPAPAPPSPAMDEHSPSEPAAAAPSRPSAAMAALDEDDAPGKGHPPWLVSLADNARARLVFAVVISLGVGFALAHTMATMQEDSAYAEIRQEITTVQSKVNNTDDWNKLDALRESALERMAAKKRNIAISSVAIMFVIGGLLTFVIVRKVPWDRYESHPGASLLRRLSLAALAALAAERDHPGDPDRQVVEHD